MTCRNGRRDGGTERGIDRQCGVPSDGKRIHDPYLLIMRLRRRMGLRLAEALGVVSNSAPGPPSGWSISTTAPRPAAKHKHEHEHEQGHGHRYRYRREKNDAGVEMRGSALAWKPGVCAD